MKIIAKIDSDNWIISADKDEIAKCLGYCYGSSIQIQVGSEINITKAYSCASALVHGNAELTAARNQLDKVLKAVDAFKKHLEPVASQVKSNLP